jgi:uncharacterized protein YqgC (DUF456 family)
MEIALLILASILTIIGVIGNIVVILPGTPLNYISLLVLHYARGGEVFSTTFLVVFGVLTAVSLAVDYLMPLLGAKLHGVSRWGVGGSIIGMLVGLVVLSLPGMILGLFSGAVIGEIIARKKTGEAIKAGIATFVGSLTAMIFKFGLSLVMAVYFFANLI